MYEMTPDSQMSLRNTTDVTGGLIGCSKMFFVTTPTTTNL